MKYEMNGILHMPYFRIIPSFVFGVETSPPRL